jgi:hypothetical protein
VVDEHFMLKMTGETFSPGTGEKKPPHNMNEKA